MHATKEEALNETIKMFKIYEKFQKEYLALPVITGRKTEKEKFAGAEETYTIEAMMYDGVALQNGTSHYFGTHFAEAFGIQFLDKDNKLKTPYQTSWGCTTRMIGGIIMTHSDDRGIVLPPKIAPVDVIVVPIGNNDEVCKYIDIVTNNLKEAGVTYKVDNTDKTPGFKFAEAEVKGYPIRIEIGKRDLENKKITFVRRDTLEKIEFNIENIKDIANNIKKLLDTIQNDMYNRALNRRNSMLYEANTMDEFIEIANNKPGFIKINWCGNTDCENKIKETTGLKSRCIIEEEKADGNCPVCGKEGKYKVYFGKQY